jgi:hypothetical protein
MQLFLRPLNGPSRTLHLHEDAHGEDLAAAVTAVTGVPACVQRLCVGGRLQLALHHHPHSSMRNALRDQGVVDGDTVHLLLRIVGGSEPHPSPHPTVDDAGSSRTSPSAPSASCRHADAPPSAEHCPPSVPVVGSEEFWSAGVPAPGPSPGSASRSVTGRVHNPDLVAATNACDLGTWTLEGLLRLHRQRRLPTRLGDTSTCCRGWGQGAVFRARCVCLLSCRFTADLVQNSLSSTHPSTRDTL